MITILNSKDTAGGKYIEGFCELADVANLPVMGICNGSRMEVIDVGLFDDGGGVCLKSVFFSDDEPATGTITEYRFSPSDGGWVGITDAYYNHCIGCNGSGSGSGSGSSGSGCECNIVVCPLEYDPDHGSWAATKTAEELMDASLIVFEMDDEVGEARFVCGAAMAVSGRFIFAFYNGATSDWVTLVADSPLGYPISSSGGGGGVEE